MYIMYEGLSRFRDVRSKPDQEKVVSSEKDVARDRERGQRQRAPEIMQSTAVTTGRPDFLPIGHPFSVTWLPSTCPTLPGRWGPNNPGPKGPKGPKGQMPRVRTQTMKLLRRSAAKLLRELDQSHK